MWRSNSDRNMVSLDSQLSSSSDLTSQRTQLPTQEQEMLMPSLITLLDKLKPMSKLDKVERPVVQQVKERQDLAKNLEDLEVQMEDHLVVQTTRMKLLFLTLLTLKHSL